MLTIDYAALGVGQYWLVDPEARTFEVLARNGDGHFVEVLVAADGSHHIPGCKGLHLHLDEWAALHADDATPDADARG